LNNIRQGSEHKKKTRKKGIIYTTLTKIFSFFLFVLGFSVQKKAKNFLSFASIKLN